MIEEAKLMSSIDTCFSVWQYMWECFHNSVTSTLWERAVNHPHNIQRTVDHVFWIQFPVLISAVGLDASELFGGSHHPKGSSDLLLSLTHRSSGMWVKRDNCAQCKQRALGRIYSFSVSLLIKLQLAILCYYTQTHTPHCVQRDSRAMPLMLLCLQF